MMAATKTEKFQLHVPNLEELCQVLEKGLGKNYADVKVCVSECPDLTQEPFKFPVKGLCGKPRITDVGGVPYLVPLVQVDKVYNMNTVAKEVELPGAFVLGAGAVSSKTVGMNAELMPLVLTEHEGKPAVNASYFASINQADGKCLQEKYRDRFSDCDFGLLANLYACEGRPGKVIEVRTSRRTGQDSLVSCMRKTMEEHYGDKSIALGGTFILQKGKAKIHIMPREFSSCPLNTNEEVNNWLKHFEVNAPLICQTVMVSKDPGLDLRVEHTHGFSHHGEGGCLSVPLFNQKKRSRLPLTSNPSESEEFSENGDMLSFTSAFHPSISGNTQLSKNRAPLAHWNQKDAPPLQESKVWPTASTGRGYTPVPHPQKHNYVWSQTGPQKPPGRQDSMAAASGFKQGGFPSGSPTTQIQNYTLNAKKPMQQQQQTCSQQQSKINRPKGFLTPSDLTAHSQRPAAQSQSSQWKMKAGGLTKGTWVENTFGTFGRESNISQQEKAPPKKSLRILTAVIEGMKYWSRYKDKVPMMFELFATLDSAVTSGKFGSKNFLMRDGKDTAPCVYYENDQVLPRLIRGQVHRCLGNYDRQKNIFTCVSVRSASLSEQRNAQEVVKASDAEMRNEVQTLSEM